MKLTNKTMDIKYETMMLEFWSIYEKKIKFGWYFWLEETRSFIQWQLCPCCVSYHKLYCSFNNLIFFHVLTIYTYLSLNCLLACACALFKKGIWNYKFRRTWLGFITIGNDVYFKSFQFLGFEGFLHLNIFKRISSKLKSCI